MKINKSYSFKLYPTKEQKQILLQHTGNSRFLWNKLVEFNNNYKKNNNNKLNTWGVSASRNTSVLQIEIRSAILLPSI